MTARPDTYRLESRPARPRAALAARLLASADSRLHRWLAQAPGPQDRDRDLILWSGLFDADWYARTYAGSVGKEPPLAHYLRTGARSGLDPNGWFTTKHYLERHGEAAIGGRAPLAHFIDTLLAAGLDPRRRSDVATHLRREAVLAGNHDPATTIPRARPIVRAATEDPDIRLMASSDLFDAGWYETTYPEHRATGLDAIEHFAAIGAFEGNDPGPGFSTRGYLDDNPDVARAGANAFLHFLRHGRSEGRSAGRLRRRLPDLFPGARRLGNAEYGPVSGLARFDRVATSLPEIGRIAVHAHLFHVEDAETIAGALRNIPGPFTLLLSIPPEQAEEIWEEFFAEQLGDRVTPIARRVQNRGRDVMPWVAAFREEVRRADLFCHVHTKRSSHLRQHRDWGRFLLHSTLGSPGVVADIVDMFVGNLRLGLVFPPYFPSLTAQPAWGQNRDGAVALLGRMGLAADPARCPDYPAGSFFWARPAALKPLLDLGLEPADFDVELGQHDGTVAHAIERLVGAVPPFLGYDIACVGVDVAYNMTRTADPGRPVATFAAPPPRPPKCDFRVAVVTHRAGRASPAGIRQDGVDYFCFVPAGTGAPSGYKPVPLRTAPDGRPDAPLAFARTHLSTYFAGYEFVIWHAPEVVILTDLNPFLVRMERDGADVGVVLDPASSDLIAAADRIVADIPSARAGVLRRLDTYLAGDGGAAIPIDPSLFILRPAAPATHALLATWWQELGLLPPGAGAIGLPYAMARSGARMTHLFRDGFSPRDEPGFAVIEPADDAPEPAPETLPRGRPS